MNRRSFFKTAGGAVAGSQLLLAATPQLDLDQCVIVLPEGASAREQKTALVLSEEVQKRSGLRWAVQNKTDPNAAAILLATRASARALGSQFKPPPNLAAESFVIQANSDQGKSRISILGADEPGLLFGAGKILRSASFGKRKARIDPGQINGSYSPRYPLRGHQLGYRPKTNAYDAWDVPVWDQYIRDLALFGTNAIELIPPRSDDEPDSPHFPLPPEEMMIAMSHICDQYGLQVWIWYPAMDPDYADPATVESALKEWEHFYPILPRIDALFVPGGDPGHTEPKAMLSFLEKQRSSLRRYHPKAQMWMSPQGFTEAWMNDFFALVGEKHTETWLDGLVFGPQSRLSLSEFRKRLPKHYPIRFYPDITHSVECQFPIPDWDVAYALTEGREVINPRPRDEANILRRYSPDTIGFITYSEGCNDDVNKFIWSSLGWDPKREVSDALREFSRYFFGDTATEGMAQGLLNLEENWRGPLAVNAGVRVTLSRFQDLERNATPALLENWRFQQALYRAYYDAAVQSRLLIETGALEKARGVLERVIEIGWAGEPTNIGQRPSATPANGLDPTLLLDEAERMLAGALTNPGAATLRIRVRELGEALFQSIHMQLAVDRYRGEAVNRAANLETLESPVTDVSWLRAQLQAVRKLSSPNEQVAAIRNLLARTDPGPGGFYDEPGNPSNRPHVLLGPGYLQDPEFRQSVLTGYDYPDRLGSTAPLAWKRWGESLFDTPFRMRYVGLDSGAHYKIRVVYSGESRRMKIRLVAGADQEVHGLIERPIPQKPLEFDLPAGAVEKGELNLSWSRQPGLGGNGRGCQICEVWLIKK